MPIASSRRTPEARTGGRGRISDFVYREVLGWILENRFRPGERLSIPALAKGLGVSQMPIRQAIDRLSEEGLVDVRPRSGTFVAQADERDIAETFDIRRALDQLAAEGAARNVCAEDLGELDDLVDRMDEFAALGGRGLQSHDRLNWEFHLFLVRLADNERLYEMYQQLNAHLKIASVHVSSRNWAERVPQAQREHRAMLGALRARDPGRLAEILTQHVERSKAALIADIRGARRELASESEPLPR